MAHGQEDSTDIIGTKGKLSVNASPQKDLVSLYHAGGITKEVQGISGKIRGGFCREVNEFAEACLRQGIAHEAGHRVEGDCNCLSVTGGSGDRQTGTFHRAGRTTGTSNALSI